MLLRSEPCHVRRLHARRSLLRHQAGRHPTPRRWRRTGFWLRPVPGAVCKTRPAGFLGGLRLYRVALACARALCRKNPFGVDEDPSPGDQTMFSAAYALAVPSVCPHLKVDEDAAKERAEEGKNAWAKSIPDHNASQLDADSILRFQEKEARKAIETDAKELPSFCARVLSAFGENGRVIPGLIVSKKRLRP